MGPELVTAIITGGISFLGIVVTNLMSNRKIENSLLTAQAVTDEKIDNLRKSVDKHNSFAQKIPVLENRICNVESKDAELENKLDDIKTSITRLETLSKQ